MLQEPMMNKLTAMRLLGMVDALKAQEQDPASRELSFLERLGLLVDHQHIDPAKPRQQTAQTAVGPRDGEVSEQRCGARVERGVSVAASLLRQCAGDEALADACGP